MALEGSRCAIEAGSAVLTRLRQALVHVRLALAPREARLAVAAVVATPQLLARAPEAGVKGRAARSLELTPLPFVALYGGYTNTQQEMVRGSLVCLCTSLTSGLSLYRSLHVSIYLSIYLSDCLTICRSVYLSICLSSRPHSSRWM